MTNTEWENMVRRYQKRVFAIALSIHRNVEDAKETTQDVFMKLYTHWDTIKEIEAIPAWLAKTCYNTAVNKLRIAKLKQWFLGTEENVDLPSLDDSPEKKMGMSQELEKIMLWKKARLSKKENVIVQLKHGEGMTLQEISDMLGIAVSSVKTHYYRAKKKLDRLQEFREVSDL